MELHLPQDSAGTRSPIIRKYSPEKSKMKVTIHNRPSELLLDSQREEAIIGELAKTGYQLP